MSDTPPDDFDQDDETPKAAKGKKAPAKKAAAKSAKDDKGGPDPIEALTANWEDPETKDLVTKQLAKEVLSKGAWATVCFLVQDLDRQKKTYKAPKISVRRYKKQGGAYRYQSGFNISSEKQAKELVGIIDKWFKKGGIGRQIVDEMGADAAGDSDD